MGEQNDMAPWVCCSFITFPSKMTDKKAKDNEGRKDGRRDKEWGWWSWREECPACSELFLFLQSNQSEQLCDTTKDALKENFWFFSLTNDFPNGRIRLLTKSKEAYKVYYKIRTYRANLTPRRVNEAMIIIIVTYAGIHVCIRDHIW